MHGNYYDRAITFFRLANVLGRPVAAGRLAATCADFRRAWQNHRHLLKPLAAYTSRRATPPQLNTREETRGEDCGVARPGAVDASAPDFSPPETGRPHREAVRRGGWLTLDRHGRVLHGED